MSLVTCRSQCEFIRLYVCYGVCQPAAGVIDIGDSSRRENEIDSSRSGFSARQHYWCNIEKPVSSLLLRSLFLLFLSL